MILGGNFLLVLLVCAQIQPFLAMLNEISSTLRLTLVLVKWVWKLKTSMKIMHNFNFKLNGIILNEFCYYSHCYFISKITNNNTWAKGLILIFLTLQFCVIILGHFNYCALICFWPPYAYLGCVYLLDGPKIWLSKW